MLFTRSVALSSRTAVPRRSVVPCAVGKQALVDAVALNTGKTKKESELMLVSVFKAIEDALVKGEKVSMPGFGTLEVRERAERAGVNPQTKEKIIIKACKRPAFSPAKALKERVNGVVPVSKAPKAAAAAPAAPKAAAPKSTPAKAATKTAAKPAPKK